MTENEKNYIEQTGWTEHGASQREIKESLARVGWMLKTSKGPEGRIYRVHPKGDTGNGFLSLSPRRALSHARAEFITATREAIETRVNIDTCPSHHVDTVDALMAVAVAAGPTWKNRLFDCWYSGNYSGLGPWSGTLQRFRNSHNGRNLINEIKL